MRHRPGHGKEAKQDHKRIACSRLDRNRQIARFGPPPVLLTGLRSRPAWQDSDYRHARDSSQGAIPKAPRLLAQNKPDSTARFEFLRPILGDEAIRMGRRSMPLPLMLVSGAVGRGCDPSAAISL